MQLKQGKLQELIIESNHAAVDSWSFDGVIHYISVVLHVPVVKDSCCSSFNTELNWVRYNDLVLSSIKRVNGAFDV